MPTVEAIQCQLGDTGVVLLPGTPEDPPLLIDDELLARLDLRVFPHHNPNGKLFVYKKHEQANRWVLDQAVDK